MSNFNPRLTSNPTFPPQRAHAMQLDVPMSPPPSSTSTNFPYNQLFTRSADPSDLNARNLANANIAPSCQASYNDDADPPFSPIQLSISAPINVKGNNNTIAFDSASMSREVSHAILAALKKGSVAENGIPMIDEEGRPRPLKLDLVMSVSIDGDGNRLGAAFEGQSDEQPRKEWQHADEKEKGTAEQGQRKVEEEQRGSKRLRTE